MKVKIVPIGNSRGIRIPASILNQFQIESEMDMLVENEKIILLPIKKEARFGWSKAFKKMSQSDDKMIISDSIDLDNEDWEW